MTTAARDSQRAIWAHCGGWDNQEVGTIAKLVGVCFSLENRWLWA